MAGTDYQHAIQWPLPDHRGFLRLALRRAWILCYTMEIGTAFHRPRCRSSPSGTSESTYMALIADAQGRILAIANISQSQFLTEASDS